MYCIISRAYLVSANESVKKANKYINIKNIVYNNIIYNNITYNNITYNNIIYNNFSQSIANSDSLY